MNDLSIFLKIIIVTKSLNKATKIVFCVRVVQPLKCKFEILPSINDRVYVILFLGVSIAVDFR